MVSYAKSDMRKLFSKWGSPKGRLILIVFALSCLVLTANHQIWRSNENDQSSNEPFWVRRELDSCKPVKNIAYLKAHKTGSSSIQSILFRYGVKRNLTFALPKGLHFNENTPFTRSMIYPKELVGKVEFNIFTIHCMWNMREIKLLMPEDTVYIGSVREPISLFESMFGFESFTQRTGLSIDEFIRRRPINSPRLKGIFGYNQMVHDYGLRGDQITNTTMVRQLIDKYDKDFDFLLVVEQMDESLILLRHLLCWDIEDIVTFKVNAIQEKFKERVSSETRPMLEQLLYPDILFYRHFREKLKLISRMFGTERMEKEKKELKLTRARIKEGCEIQEKNNKELPKKQRATMNKIIGFEGRDDEECEKLTFSSKYFKEFIKSRSDLNGKNIDVL